MKNSICIPRRIKLIHVFSLIVLFTFLNVNLSSAQYHSFPIEDGRWVNKERTYYLDMNNFPVYTTTWIDKYCASGSDTMINTTSYKQIDFCTAQNSNYHGALRYNSGQVYFVPRDSLNEFLLYDFTLNIGESVDVIFQNSSGNNPSYSMATTVINNIDTITVNGTPRRRLYTEGYEWIEGIGCVSGLFMEPWINVSNYFRELLCMSKSDTTHYNGGPLITGTPGVCELTLNTIELDQNNNYISIYPNPTSDRINVQTEKEIQKIEAYNLMGKLVFKQTVNSNHTHFNVSHLSKGIYIIHIGFEEGIVTKKVVLN